MHRMEGVMGIGREKLAQGIYVSVTKELRDLQEDQLSLYHDAPAAVAANKRPLVARRYDTNGRFGALSKLSNFLQIMW